MVARGPHWGVFIVTPVLLTLRHLPHIDHRPWPMAEATGSLAVFMAISVLVFVGPLSLGSGQYPLAFLPLPCIVWVAFRFDPRGVALATSILSGIAITATSHGPGPFFRVVTSESLLLFQAFTGLTTLTGLTLAAAITGHRRAETSLRRLNVELEQRVRERTAELEESHRQLASEIIGHQQAEEKARQLALTDEVTGLYNRRGFLLLANQYWKINRRTHSVCLLVYVDLDGVKQVNDVQGHAVGDALIVDAARVLTKVFRESDVIARLGGDEFAILASGNHTDAAVAISERLRAIVDEFNQQSGRPYQLSMSFGIEELPSAANISPEAMVTRADQAMYVQKRAKRQP